MILRCGQRECTQSSVRGSVREEGGAVAWRRLDAHQLGLAHVLHVPVLVLHAEARRGVKVRHAAAEDPEALELLGDAAAHEERRGRVLLALLRGSLALRHLALYRALPAHGVCRNSPNIGAQLLRPHVTGKVLPV